MDAKLQELIENKNQRDVELVQQIGKSIGYGHMMSLASALWRKSLADGGFPIIGAFVPTCEPFIKDEYLDTLKGENLYDELVKKYAK